MPICICILPTVGYMQMSISKGCFGDNSYLREMPFLITFIEVINIMLPQITQMTRK